LTVVDVVDAVDAVGVVGIVGIVIHLGYAVIVWLIDFCRLILFLPGVADRCR